MKRIADYFLLEWKNLPRPKPLLVRGARQVGKTYAVQALGKTFPRFVEVNLETDDGARKIIGKDLDPHRMILQLSEYLGVEIIPGQTLLFFDEIQKVPKAITALRYFYEKVEGLHVIAAGSLLDFAIDYVGMPVGRVSSLFMYPLSFLEFLVARGDTQWAQAIIRHSVGDPISEPLHEKLLDVVGEYIAVGGLPGAVNEWLSPPRLSERSSRAVKRVHADLIFNYREDIKKYAEKDEVAQIEAVFDEAVKQVGRKFVFANIEGYRKRELDPSLKALEKAGLMHRVVRSSGQGIPLGSFSDKNDFKVLLLDVGMTQALNKFDISSWLIDPSQNFVNQGEIVEAFVGQELLAYSDPIMKEELFYWRRQERTSQAEIDYLIQLRNKVIPLEVKAGTDKRMKSIRIFLDEHARSPYGIRFSSLNYEQAGLIHSYPLYAVAKTLFDANEVMREALLHLVT